MASEPARARLLWAILSLVLPVTFGCTTACRSPALAFSAASHFAMKRSTPCYAALRHFLLVWAAVVYWSGLMPKALRPSRKHPIHYLSCSPTAQPASPILGTSRTSTVSYSPCVPQILRTRSVSSVKCPRCSHIPSISSACPDRESDGRRYCSFANRCSDSESCVPTKKKSPKKKPCD